MPDHERPTLFNHDAQHCYSGMAAEYQIQESLTASAFLNVP
ncbi:hypothetical protein [Lolliginicoccus lacisalsi]|nr:hypothetical protein [Lolliginicoccus lacisalsi]